MISHKKKIYIVEDSLVVSMELTQKLKQVGYTITGSAISGEDALKDIENLLPDLILMDIKLAGEMDGVETAHIVKERFDIPVIFTTAFSDSKTINSVKNSGHPYGYLIKPYNTQNLLVSIEVAFTRYTFEKKLKDSEEKYRILVEGTDDIIFSIDKDGNFLSVNNAVKNHLNIKPDSVIGKNFIDLLYSAPDSDENTINIAKEKLDVATNDLETVLFKVELKSRINSEPIEMNIRLEPLKTENSFEIIGKAYKNNEDLLLKYYESETQKYSIGNHLIIADEMSRRLTRNLPKYMDGKDGSIIRVAIREILLNSIEHGNLEISFDQKTEAIKDGKYFSLLTTKQNEPHLKNRKVNIEFSIDEEKAVYTISDQGEGFNYEAFINKSPNETNLSMLTHGRGITMAQNIFDKMTFNDKGNKVKLVKLFK
jgi:PAS domain S-box-containing protein